MAYIVSTFGSSIVYTAITPYLWFLGGEAAHLLKRTSLTEEQKSHVAMLNNGGEVLVALLNDVLDISKIEAGKMEIEEAVFNLSEALEALVSLYGPRAQANGVRLVLDKASNLPALIRTDPHRSACCT